MTSECPYCEAQFFCCTYLADGETVAGDRYECETEICLDGEVDFGNACLIAQLSAAQAVINKLPKTADGVPVVPQVDHVYLWHGGKVHKGWIDLWESPTDDKQLWRGNDSWSTGHGDSFEIHHLTRPLTEWSSTPEAAEAAGQAAAKEEGKA